METKPVYLSICTNDRLTGQVASCGGRGAEALALRLEQSLQRHGFSLSLQRSGCLGHCAHGPTLRLAHTAPISAWRAVMTR